MAWGAMNVEGGGGAFVIERVRSCVALPILCPEGLEDCTNLLELRQREWTGGGGGGGAEGGRFFTPMGHVLWGRRPPPEAGRPAFRGVGGPCAHGQNMREGTWTVQ